MISEQIDRVFSPVRDGLARALLAAGLRPNHVTVAGMLLTVGAGVAVACGRAAWRPWAVSLILAAGACDLLDGSMAKRSQSRTRFGAVLDSTCDRVSDAALYLGTVFYFLLRPDDRASRPPNVTMALLAAFGLVWAYLVSYVRARAQAEGLGGHGGFWQRPERIVTMLLGLAFHHLSTAVWILGIAPIATVAHRLLRVRRSCRLPDRSADEEQWPRGLAAVVLWRWPRGTWPFDLQAGATIAALVFLDLPQEDLLRNLWVAWVGA